MPNQSANRLLKPEILARLSTLDLVARAVVEGVSTGMHRSPRFGFSQEFAEYRAYHEGDDLRYVDWNVYARTDRTYIKRFQGETNTTIHLLLDTSASMGFGDPVSKLQQSLFLLASIAFVAHRQHDALGLAIFDEQVRQVLPPSSRPDTLGRLLSTLQSLKPGNGTDILQALGELQMSIRRRGLVIIVSDLYTNVERVFTALQPLVHHGHDVAVFHVLDSDELSPSRKTISIMQDLETREEVIVDPRFLQGRYQQKIAAHCRELEQTCRRLGADYTRILSSEPLDAALQAYLRFRESRQR